MSNYSEIILHMPFTAMIALLVYFLFIFSSFSLFPTIARQTYFCEGNRGSSSLSLIHEATWSFLPIFIWRIGGINVIRMDIPSQKHSLNKTYLVGIFGGTWYWKCTVKLNWNGTWLSLRSTCLPSPTQKHLLLLGFKLGSPTTTVFEM